MIIIIGEFYKLARVRNPRLPYGLKFTTKRDEGASNNAFMYVGARLAHARTLFETWCAEQLGQHGIDWEIDPSRHVIWLHDPKHADMIRLIWHKARIADPTQD